MRNTHVQSVAPTSKVSVDYHTVTCWTKFSMIFTGAFVLAICVCQYFAYNIGRDKNGNEKWFLHDCVTKTDDAHFLNPWCGYEYEQGAMLMPINPFYWVIGLSSMYKFIHSFFFLFA